MHVLDDVNVLDFSQSVAGPYATTLLADFGADVVSVEPPGGGDQRRILHGSFMPTAGRNKRSIVVDLKGDGAPALIEALTAWADVVVHNYRPGTMERLGCDYDTLSALDEDLVYVSITGFGENGPYSDRPGFDPIAQAMSGLMWATGEPDRKPSRVGTSPIDYSTGLFAALSALVALWRRERSGTGAKIEVSLFETAATFMGEWYTHFDATGEQPTRRGHTWDGYAPTGLFETATGLIYLSVPYDDIWQRFCQAIDRDAWLEDSRYESNESRLANREALYADIEDVFGEYERADLVQLLLDTGVPVAELQTVAEATRDEHLAARGLLTTGTQSDGSAVTVAKTPVHVDGELPPIRTAASQPGADTADVLSDLSLADGLVDRLESAGTIPER